VDLRVQKLIEELRKLAAEPDEQLEALEELGHDPPEHYIDELALDYDAIAAAARGMMLDGVLSQTSCECVTHLNAFLESFSGSANAHLWTGTALRDADEWRMVRAMAKDCLKLMADDSP